MHYYPCNGYQAVFSPSALIEKKWPGDEASHESNLHVFGRGLNVLGVLSLLKAYPSLFRPLFVKNKDDELTCHDSSN